MFSLLLAYAMAVPAPEPTPEAAPEAEADPAVLATSTLIKAPVVVPAYYHVPYYYGYHLIGKRSAEPQPMDQFQADPRFARHMPSPYMRSRYV